MAILGLIMDLGPAGALILGLAALALPARAETVITKNMASLNALADALLKDETLEEEKVKEILKDAVLPKEVMLHAA